MLSCAFAALPAPPRASPRNTPQNWFIEMSAMPRRMQPVRSITHSELVLLTQVLMASSSLLTYRPTIGIMNQISSESLILPIALFLKVWFGLPKRKPSTVRLEIRLVGMMTLSLHMRARRSLISAPDLRLALAPRMLVSPTQGRFTIRHSQLIAKIRSM